MVNFMRKSDKNILPRTLTYRNYAINCFLKIIIFLQTITGTIHSNERSVYEEWPGLLTGLFHHGSVNI